MKEVFIDGIIGYEWIDDACITAKKIKKQLAKLEDGEEIKITIDSPGGSVSEGVVIFNLIRDYAKEHPVSTRINCKALSMASYIALAARTVNKTAKVTASENSTMMIHNPYGAVVGDYRKMKNSADYLEKLAVLYGSVHSGVAGRPDKEIRDAMDKETFYVGKEIQEIGFANDFEIIIENDTNGSAMGGGRDALIANARLELDRAIMKDYEAKAKDPVAYLSEFDKMVALFNVSEPPAAESAKTSGKNNFGGCMTPEELKAQNKALYDAIFAQGEAAGIEKERARVNAYL
jgi:ATP-dependent protease ClpP protease subunit